MNQISLILKHYSIFIVILFLNITLTKSNDVDVDSNWMSYLDGDLRLNRINIPGTHDSGTFGMTSIGIEQAGKTQDYDITEQLERGIRYFDLRIARYDIEKGKYDLRIVHGEGVKAAYGFEKDGSILTLVKVFKHFTDFLEEHGKETIIAHIKVEDEDYELEAKKLLVDYIINDNCGDYPCCPTCNSIYEDDEGKWGDINDQWCKVIRNCDRFYFDNLMPTLDEVRGRIVLATRDDKLTYKGADGVERILGLYIPVSSYGEDYFDESDVVRTRDCVDNNYKCYIQDAYNLDDVDDKYKAIKKLLYDENIKNDNALALNYMNINNWEELFGLLYKRLFDKIKIIGYLRNEANDINEKFLKENLSYSEYYGWIVTDFPGKDLIRKIYQTNPNVLQHTKVEISGKSVFSDIEYYFLKVSYNILKNLPLLKRDDNTLTATKCLQRELITDKYGNKYDKVTTDSKCNGNSKSKWYIEKNNNDNNFKIISAYDKQCLVILGSLTTNEGGVTLGVNPCGKGNTQVSSYETFTINEGKICATGNKDKCLGGHYEILTSLRYESDLTCSLKFIKDGYECCSDCNVVITDEIGRWGVENDDWCGIPYNC